MEQLAPVMNSGGVGGDAGHLSDTSQVVTFRLGTEQYGIDVMNVQEIILLGKVTKMPGVPPYVWGLANLRGHVIPVIDLAERFKLRTSQRTDESRIIVVNLSNRTIGLIVDAVTEVERVRMDQLEPCPFGMTGQDQQYVAGLIKLENQLLMMLDVEQLLTE